MKTRQKSVGNKKRRNHWGFTSFASRSTSGLLRQTNRSRSFYPSSGTPRRKKSSCTATCLKRTPHPRHHTRYSSFPPPRPPPTKKNFLPPPPLRENPPRASLSP